MDRWEWFLRKDEECDIGCVGLAHAGRPGLHCHSQNWMNATGVGVEWAFLRPTEEESRDWEKAVRSLRCVGRRIGGFKPIKSKFIQKKEPGIDPVEADKVMAAYVGMLQLKMPDAKKPLRSGEGYKLVPRPEPITTFGAATRLTFQALFASLLPGFRDPVCATCGKSLPLTRRGKVSKAIRCRGCTFKAWWADQPIEARRQHEAKKKRSQRERVKEDAARAKRGK